MDILNANDCIIFFAIFLLLLKQLLGRSQASIFEIQFFVNKKIVQVHNFIETTSGVLYLLQLN